MKEQSNGVPAALPTLLRAVEAEQASGCAAAEAARVGAPPLGGGGEAFGQFGAAGGSSGRCCGIGAERRGAL